MRLVFAIFTMALFFSKPAAADVVYLDLFSGGSRPTVGSICGKSICLNNTYYSSVFDLAPGSTVDFGSVAFSPGTLGNGIYFSGAVQVWYAPVEQYLPIGGSPLCNGSFCAYPFTYHLIFTLPEDATKIQIALAGLFIYSPPSADQIAGIPESSTWAMLILGFVGIGFATYRQRGQRTLRTARLLQ